MSGDKCGAYRREMDGEHIPEEKAAETLRLMLDENRRLREREARRSRPLGRILLRRVLPAAAAVAACVALVIFGMSRVGGPTFTEVHMSRIPVTGISRGSEAEVTDFAAAFGCTPESLFPGWTVTEGVTLREQTAAGTRSEGRLTLQLKHGITLGATVTDFAPPLAAGLADSGSGPDGEKLGLDPDTGTRYALLRRGGLYAVLSSGALSESDFVSAAKGIAKVWQTQSE